MRVDRRRLHRNVDAFLKGPAGGKYLDELTAPLGVLLFATGVALCVGLVLIPTVVGTVTGLKQVMYAVRFKAFSDDTGRQLRRRLSELKPLLTHGVIVGPRGHGLVLGTFRDEKQVEPDLLAVKALRFADLYSDGSDDPADGPMIALLRRDHYIPDRRRRVPESFAGGDELYLFDVKIDVTQTAPGPLGGAVVACVATPGETGVIGQIPWKVVRDAVSADAK